MGKGAHLILDVYSRRPGEAAAQWLVDDESGIELDTAVGAADRRRLRSELLKKAVNYKEVCEGREWPLILAVTVGPAMLEETSGKDSLSILDELFALHPHVGGVHLVESTGRSSVEVTFWRNSRVQFVLPSVLCESGLVDQQAEREALRIPGANSYCV